MNFLKQTIAIFFGVALIQCFLPWWTLAIVALAAGYLLKSKYNFLAGFIAVALLWAGYAYFIDANGAAPLADRVASILYINKPLLFLATAFLGGLVGGFASLTGSLLKKDKRKSLYY